MRSKETGFGFILVLAPGDELIRSLIAFARSHDIDGATITGVGTVREADLGTWSPQRNEHVRRTFNEELDVCAISGNLALLDGEPMPHVHAVFARSDFSTVGGHVFQAVCSTSVEIAIHMTREPLERTTASERDLLVAQEEEA